MWEFVESVRGVADACHAITLKDNPDDATPIIAGNVSFYNESKNGAIPPSPIVSCLGRLKNVNKTVPMHFQKADSVILMAGERKDELGGSVYYSLHDELGTNVPEPDFEDVKNQIYALTDCIDDCLILSCHDISDGGVSSSLAEMTFGNGIGCDVEIKTNLSPDKILFSETGGFILEVSAHNVIRVSEVFSEYGQTIFNIGKTNFSNSIKLNRVINLGLDKAKDAWDDGLRQKL
jgi:phosphoribosylformylglycinamidine synthase